MAPLLAELRPGIRFWRGHSLLHPGHEFNPTGSITRFTPVSDASGARLPYVYLGDTSDVAIAETVLHDVPSLIPAAKLETMALSELRVRRAVTLIDLTGHGLKRIHRTQAEIITSDASDYAHTATIAQDLLDAAPAAEGILYPSRQFGAGRCAVIYRRGRKRNPFERLQTLPMGAGPAREWVDLACHKAGVVVVH